MKLPPLATDLRRAPGLAELNGHAVPAVRSPALRAAFVLSWVVAALMLIASAWGLIADELYNDGAWGREAFRGGDAITFLLAVPILAVALALSIQGSRRAEVVWVGMLVYAAYTYAYAVFGARFNDAFLLHIAILSTSLFALACVVPNLDRAAIAGVLRSRRRARWVGGFLVVAGAAQGLLWSFLIVRNALTGELLHDIPVNGQHLVFALDLLLMPLLIVSGVLLWRERPMGYVLGPAMAVMGAVCQLNLRAAALYQDRADVPGVQALPPEGIVLTIAFIVAALVILTGRTERPPGSARGSSARRA